MAIASNLTEAAFSERRRTDWNELDELTRTLRGRRLRTLPSSAIVRLPPLYRDVCADLAAAEAARYSAPLVDYLRALTATAHGLLYDRRGSGRSASLLSSSSVGHTWFVAFPRAVRRHHRAMLLAAVLFVLPLVVGLVLTLRDPSFAFRVTPEANLKPLAEAYAHGFDAGRSDGEGAMMSGFYVYNNVGIALRCFALGIFAGLGSAFYLVQNGLTIGAVFGYVSARGAGANIATFIVGHGSLELGAIIIAGGAGLSLGWSLIAPGELTRIASLRNVAREIVVIAFGAAIMLVMAAGIEGFWSASSAPAAVKIGIGALLFVLVVTYVALAGRNAPVPDDRGIS